MNYHDIRSALSQFFKTRLSDIRATMQETGPLPAERITMLKNSISLADWAIQDNQPNNLFDDTLFASIADKCALPITPDSAEFITFKTTTIKAYKSYCQQVIAQSERYSDFDFSSSTKSPAIAPKDINVAPTALAKAVTDYIAELRRLKTIRDKSIDEKESYLSLLQELLGPHASLHVSPDQADIVKQTLMRLPKRMRLNKQFAGMSAPEIAALPDNHPDKIDNLLDNATISKYMSCFISFYDWAVKKRATAENNFKSINIKINFSAQRREAFEPAQLAMIISEALKEQNNSYKWGALLGCYTGARLEELAQLQVDDLKQENGVWFIDINENNGKRLKNPSSKRWVPLHSKLIEFGFLDFLNKAQASGTGRVLYGLTFAGQNGYGRNLSRWFNDRLLPNLGLKKKELTFHSLRHSFSTELQRAGVQY